MSDGIVDSPKGGGQSGSPVETRRRWTLRDIAVYGFYRIRLLRNCVLLAHIYQSSENTPLYQHLAGRKNPMWHYTRVIWVSNGQSVYPSRRGIDAQRIINPAQSRFGGGCLTDVQCAAVALTERRGHPLLHRQDLTQAAP